MKVGELDKRFDFVASSGVLHHLKDPEKGLRAILDTLKPDGRMSISLYSKFARDYALNPATDYIKSKGYTSSLDDIRQFRKDLMGMTADNPITRCTTAGDFYSLAECNDLLFHIQEHRYTPHQIWDMADRFGLEPILVSITPERMKKFRDMFPDGNTLDPDRLDAFEKEHPLAFIEMIKVFFRRKGSTAPHPLDFLIFNELL
jgi:SAM-dependent methyltransferase